MRITPQGKAYLQTKPKKITRADLMAIPQFKAFMLEHKKSIAKTLIAGTDNEVAAAADADPEELIAQAYGALRANLATGVIEPRDGQTSAFL